MSSVPLVAPASPIYFTVTEAVPSVIALTPVSPCLEAAHWVSGRRPRSDSQALERRTSAGPCPPPPVLRLCLSPIRDAEKRRRKGCCGWEREPTRWLERARSATELPLRRLALAPPSLPAAANSATLDRPVARLALFHLHLGKLSPLDLLEDIARMTLRWAHGARESSLKTCTSKVPPW